MISHTAQTFYCMSRRDSSVANVAGSCSDTRTRATIIGGESSLWSNRKVGWVARFTKGYWRACSAIGLSHETASLIVATVPELLPVLLAARQESQASRLQQLRRRVRVLSRYGKRGPGLAYHLPTWSSAIDKQTASGSDLSECSPLESPGYLTPANPGRQGTIRPRWIASLTATGDPMIPRNIRDDSVSRQGARFVLS